MFTSVYVTWDSEIAKLLDNDALTTFLQPQAVMQHRRIPE
jgi:hypothetical protein